MKKINLLLIAILAIFPLGQWTRLPISWPFVHIYAHDLLILVLSFVLLKKQGFRKLINSPIFKIFLPFLVICFASLLINLGRWGVKNSILGSLYLVRYLAYLFIFLSAVYLSKENKNKLLKLLLTIGWITAVMGLIQYFVYPDFRSWELFGWDPHLYRIVGTYFDPGFTGLIYAWSLILILVLFWKKIAKLDLKIIIFWIAPIFLALILTYSRSTYLAFLGAIGLIALVKKNGKIFIISVSLLVLALLFLPRKEGIGTKLERQDSWFSRVESWKNSFQIIKKNPLLGVGFNNYRFAQQEAGYLESKSQEDHGSTGVDNSLLFVLATTGVLGFAAFSYFWIKVIKKRNLLISAILVSWIISSFFNNSLFYPWAIVEFWIILGLVVDG
ncbi:MAG: O-antigen ligase family protein [Candidatus Shapirobacteria bacterium]